MRNLVMRNIFMRNFLIWNFVAGLFFVLIFSSALNAQVVTFSPLHPNERDTVTINYNALKKNASFSKKDSLFVVIWKYFQDENYKSEWKPMEKTDSGFTAKIYVDSNTAGVKLWFLNLYDQKFGMASFMVYDKNGTPVRNAYHEIRELGDSKSIDLELKNFPDNYLAYIDKWLDYKLAVSDSLEDIINNDLKYLEAENTSNAERLFAITSAYALNEDTVKCIQTLDTLVSKFPNSVITLRAVVLAEGTLRNYGPLNKQILELRDKALKMNAEKRMAREIIYIRGINDTSFAETCRQWINDEPDNPEPYICLANMYFQDSTKLDLVPGLTNKAAELILDGKLRVYVDISGKLSGMQYTECYFLQAEAYKRKHQYLQALRAIKSADPDEAVLIRKARMMEGDLWEKLANYNRAERSYLDAWNNGEKKAKDALRNLYLKLKDMDDFEKYFAEKTKGDQPSSNKNTVEVNRKYEISKPKEPAPEFDVTSIDGKKFKLSELKGKVIVANFWFTGCTPCKLEIPELNKLADKYKDCVFLAFSPADDKATVKRFLAKNPFKFNIIPEASAVCKKFNIKAYPSTIIISPEGKIHHFEVGGGENIEEVLSIKIDELLKK